MGFGSLEVFSADNDTEPKVLPDKSKRPSRLNQIIQQAGVSDEPAEQSEPEGTDQLEMEQV